MTRVPKLKTVHSSLFQAMYRSNLAAIGRWGTLFGLVLALSSCSRRDGVGAQPKPTGGTRDRSAAVDVAIAATAPLQSAREYTGTTQPVREVAIRAQAEGQLRQLNVDVGSLVEQGQTLAQIDNSLLDAATAEADAELASRRAEIGQLQSQVTDARTQVEQNRLQLQQAEFDAARYESLVKAGAIPQQQAQQSRTQAGTAAQILRSAQAKVLERQQAIGVAESRIVAQQAVVAQQEQRGSYAVVTAPLSGVVLTRSTEQGNLVQVGNELVRLGDFSQAKVTVQVSELDLANVQVGGAATVRLDAFPTQQFTGRTIRISPVANSTSRLVPVEISIPNPTGRVGSGLLARVSFTQPTTDRVVVPISALQESRSKSQPAGASNQNVSATTRSNAPPTKGTVFVVNSEGEGAKVVARSVALGERLDGKVEIRSGLNPGERFVTRSSKPLKDGESVKLSILSTK